MIFTDIAYFIFLALVVLAYRQAGVRARPYVIIASGLAFYAYYATGFAWLFIAEALAVYFLTRENKFAYLAALALPLVVLGYYKYAAFFYSALFNGPNPFAYIAFPLAISFFTFEFLHYSFDWARGRISKPSVTNFMAFAFFFPSMAAGPIKRFQEFDAQLREAPAAGAGDLYAGGVRIIGGLFKKLVLADSLAYFSSVLASSFYVEHATAYQLWFALAAFTLKVYFDFSGYSDIAIGSARLFGIKIPENFDYPLLARNIAQFWRKWHMSLYSWLNDYVFTPLSVSLRNWKAWGLAASILAVFGASGLWHGSDWNFIAWGLAHGAAVVAYFIYTRTLKPFLSRKAWYATSVANAAAVGINLVFVVASFSLFAAPLSTAALVLQKIFLLA